MIRWMHGKGFLGILACSVLLLAGCESWEETYRVDDEGPYGVSALPGILKEAFLEKRYEALERAWADEGLLDRFEQEATYVAIGPGLSYTPTEAQALDTFVRRGGTAFLAAKLISYSLLSKLAPDSCLFNYSTYQSYYHHQRAVMISSRGERLIVPNLVRLKGSGYRGNYLYRDTSCLHNPEDLLVQYGRKDSLLVVDSTKVYPMMVRLRHGAGSYVLLAQPRLLSNIHATDSLGRLALETVLSYLPRDPEAVLFDIHRHPSEQDVANTNDWGAEVDGKLNPELNILKHVISRPPLAAAWYAVLGGILLFLWFGSRRRQRVVPLTQPRRNTTHAYLGNIARLYLDKPNNLLMARKQLALFESFCVRRFGLNPLKNTDDADRVKHLRGVDEQTFESILRYANTINRGQTLTNGGFVTLVRLIQSFYASVTGRPLL